MIDSDLIKILYVIIRLY